MGTNYFLDYECCDKCGRGKDRLHIGKSSAGWTFTFQGYPADYDDPQIKSFADWQREFQKPGVRIVDEYGEFVTVEAFEKMVAAKSDAKFNHFKEAKKSDWGRYDNSWLDPDGHSFSLGEFS